MKTDAQHRVDAEIAERDYLREAHEIMTGATTKSVERGHLVAVQQAANEAIAIALMQNRLLISVLLNKRVTHVQAPGVVVRDIERRGLDLHLERSPDGSLSARLLIPAPRVM